MYGSVTIETPDMKSAKGFPCESALDPRQQIRAFVTRLLAFKDLQEERLVKGCR
jgi:hypothetical protein